MIPVEVHPDFLSGIKHPGLSLHVLKVVFACCHVNLNLCQVVMDSCLQTFLLLLESEAAEGDASHGLDVEIVLYLLSLLVVRLQDIPEP
eukprot:gi/632991638/ref/XP_007884719.1/ PREDICTED: serine/threonine-protein kinase 36-like [Callorhinchus milii]